MTPRVKRLYESAVKNKVFLSDIRKADNDKKPGIFADNETKVLFATVYYGWLVAKYGKHWENLI